MAPRIVDKTEKRKQIALAAMRVFADTGFERTTIEAVSRAAGVGKGTVYEYFANKAELIEGALGALLDEYMALLSPAMDERAPAVETLRSITTAFVDALSEFGTLYHFFVEYMLYACRNPSGNVLMADMIEGFRRTLEVLFERGKTEGSFRADLDPAAAAASYAAWFDGAIFHWMTAPEGPTLKQMADQYLDLMLRGMLADTSGGAP